IKMLKIALGSEGITPWHLRKQDQRRPELSFRNVHYIPMGFSRSSMSPNSSKHARNFPQAFRWLRRHSRSPAP
ncbi:MAG: hypothetical protein WB561_11995, partial [Terracidiphilus sp.]